MRGTPWRRGFLIGFLLLVVFWLATLIWGLAGKAHIAISRSDIVRAQYDQMEKRKGALTKSLAALATERGQDAAIRTAFGVARPGEEVIVVVPPATTTATTTPSWWDRFLGWF